MHCNHLKIIKALSLALVTGFILPATTFAADSTSVLQSANHYLPVQSEGFRFTSTPYGESRAILSVAKLVRQHGVKQAISSRGLHIPSKSENRVIQRYDLTLPASCGNHTFSYYEGKGFSALGYHTQNKVVFDLLNGGGPYSAPRLWGPYDQVVNDPAPMHVVYSGSQSSGFGQTISSFMAGKVADMSQQKSSDYGSTYSEGVFAASSCDALNNMDNILVKK